MSADPDQATVNQPNPRALASRKRPSTSSSQPAQKEVSVSPYQDISVIKLLNKAKFPVYLTCSQSTKQQFAMKTFPFVNGRPHRYYQNESRFVGLHHNNVINVEHSENKKPMIHRGCQVEMSYILMEYAPYGDFFDLVNSCKIKDDNKLIRTYFKQLINGMDYLHKHGVAHLDLKLDNLLVGEDYTLKIADFDLSYMTGDEEVLARGTKCYRCPEFIRGRCVNFVAADVYSAGIILFILKSGGLMPHSENTPVKGIDFYDLLYTDNQKFWEKHQQFQKGQDVFDLEFKELFISMTKLNASDRASLEDVKNSKWYSGDVYTDEELSKVMQGHMRS